VFQIFLIKHQKISYFEYFLQPVQEWINGADRAKVLDPMLKPPFDVGFTSESED